jgi:HEAT repeat protein
MGDIMKKFQPLVILSILTLVFFISAPFANELPPQVTPANAVDHAEEEIVRLLEQIQWYEYGMSREPLSELSDLLVKIESKETLVAAEYMFIDFLKSDATLPAKQFICRKLSIIGTDASVPVLQEMLMNDETADMARYALERIPSQDVEQALLTALEKTDGRTRIGIINSLGKRGSQKSVKPLSLFLEKGDQVTLQAAATALGKIDGSDAAQALQRAQKRAMGSAELAIKDGLLLCADNLLENGEVKQATEIYSNLYKSESPAPIRVAALRGMIKTSQDEAPSILLNATKDESAAIISAAIDLLRESPKIPIQKMAPVFNELAPRFKVQLLAALADLKDETYQAIAVNALQAETVEVRKAALQALIPLGDASVVIPVAEIAATAPKDEADQARATLARMPASSVDEAVLNGIENTEGKVRVELINAVSERYITTAVPTVLAMSRQGDDASRNAAIKVLGDIAKPEDLSKLLDVLVHTRSNSETEAAVLSVAQVASQIDEQAERGELVLQKLDNTEDVQDRIALMRVLGKIGDPDGLDVLRQALGSNDEETQVAAVRALSDWPSSAPADELFDLAKNSQSPRVKVLALRGYIELIRNDQDLSDDEKTAMLQNAMHIAEQVNEKRMILSGLGELNSVTALNAALGYLKMDTVVNEAGAAIVQISDSIRGQQPEKVKAALQTLLETVENPNIQEDAKNVLEKVK